MKNVLYYKYVKLNDLEQFGKDHLALCKSLSLKGKVLVAHEGINGCLTGTDENIQHYVENMRKDPRFTDIDFKEARTNKHGFERMLVKIRDEIIATHVDNDNDLIDYKAPYVEPLEFKEWLDEGKDIVVIDARNNYESEIGAFENAITPDIRHFSQFPDAVKALEHLKDKTIVTYCTGGIRCEKFSGYMRKQGFENVFQLHGGIIKYGIEAGGAHWKGKCLVFDRRGAIELDPTVQKPAASQCCLCYLPEENKYHCKRERCDHKFISCDACYDLLEGCCTKSCRNHNRKLSEAKSPVEVI